MAFTNQQYVNKLFIHTSLIYYILFKCTVFSVCTEMARHNQGGEIPAEDTAPKQHRIQRLLPARAHCLGKIQHSASTVMTTALYYTLMTQRKKNMLFTKNAVSLQLVMEYCLGSASDLLEGELKTFGHCMRQNDC